MAVERTFTREPVLIALLVLALALGTVDRVTAAKHIKAPSPHYQFLPVTPAPAEVVTTSEIVPVVAAAPRTVDYERVRACESGAARRRWHAAPPAACCFAEEEGDTAQRAPTLCL